MARNVTIDEAKGKWLIQVDGDDVLLEGAIDECRRYIDDSDYIQFDAVEFTDVPSLESWSPKGENLAVKNEMIKDYHYKLIDHSASETVFPTYNMNPAWSKVWNLDFIRSNNLHYFSEVNKGEGTLFTFLCSYYIKKVSFVNIPIYGYRINPYSIMRRFSSDILDNQNVQFNTYKKVIESHNELDNPIILNALLKRDLYLIENAENLGVAHPNCNYTKQQSLDWIKQLCSYDWAQGSRLIMITAHRRENLGEPMRNMFRAIKRVLDEHDDVKAIYPIHMNPVVRETADSVFGNDERIRIIEPLEVLDFHNFLSRSYLILTDSGGIQEEAPSLGKPVLVMRDTTERPEGIAAGTLKLVGTSEETIYNEFKSLLEDRTQYDKMSKAFNPYGDGFACKRIADILEKD